VSSTTSRRPRLGEVVSAIHEVIGIQVPTHALPNDQCFVLDRNHRLPALTFASTPFRITLWNVRGPLQAHYVRDLTCWLPKDARYDSSERRNAS
jgi:hypothetical protein